MELDNTADEFRRLHAERQDLVRQWQTAIDSMRRRDTEINTVGEKYAAARQVRVERAEALAQNAARLKMQKNDNQEVSQARGELAMGGRASDTPTGSCSAFLLSEVTNTNFVSW